MNVVLQKLQLDIGFLRKNDCSLEENQMYTELLKKGKSLPEGVYPDYSGNNRFYTISDAGLTDAEKQEYIRHQQFFYIKTIKKCIVFFTVLTVISLIAGAITAIAVLASI